MRNRLAQQEFENLPVRESIRASIWRGKNCFGDNTSFGEYNSGEVRQSVLERMLQSGIGENYDSWYSRCCSKFQGRDRIAFDLFVDYAFRKDGFRFGMHLKPDYVVVEGKIRKA
jgi:hypothetical protein